MKKILAIFLACMMIFSTLPAVVLADDVHIDDSIQCTCPDAVRTGTYDKSVAATCVSVPYDVYVCNLCGKKYTVVTGGVDTTAHNPEQIVQVAAKAPTCTDIGWGAYEYCAAELDGYECPYTTYVEIPALGHSYGTVVTPPTCEDDGYTTYTCTVCGDTYTGDVVPALNHDYATVVTPPTCEDEGYTTYTCKNDPTHTYVADHVPALGHDWKEVARQDATCHVAGWIEYVCNNDPAHTKTDVIPTDAAHKYVKVGQTDATCLLPAQETYECSACGYQIVLDIAGSAPLGHTEKTVPGQAATCDQDGYTDSVVCDVCGVVLQAATVIPAHHTQVENVPEKLATCTEKGYSAHQWCSACDTVIGFVSEYPIDPNNHTALEQVAAKEETCTNIGWAAYEKCDACGYSTYVEIPADPTKHVSYTITDRIAPTCMQGGWTRVLGCSECKQTIAAAEPIPVDPTAHNYAEVVTAPTCTDQGYTTFTCTNCDADGNACGDTYVGNYVAANGHKWVEKIVDPTCTTAGSMIYTCSVCGDVLTYPGVPALGHTLTYVAAQAPTCTEIGWNDYEYCTVCDYTTYVELPALGHTKGDTVGTAAPTCTEAGYDIAKCLVCGQNFKEETAPALGHKMISVAAQAPTCIDIGWNAYEYCDRCGISTYVEIPATGHSYDAVVTAPTCVDDGYTTHTCSVCGDSYKDTIVPALGHTAGSTVQENPVAPDCVTAGSYEAVIYCSVCNAEMSRVTMPVPALGHTEAIDAAVAPTFDTTGLTEGKHCSVCGVVLVPQTEVPVLDEKAYFSYVVEGINGSLTATNSGFVTLKVYLNVDTEQARLWGIDLGIVFGDELTLVEVSGQLFANATYTALDKANADNKVVLSQTGAVTASENKLLAKGEYLFAELTFKVADDFCAADTTFTFDETEYARNAEANTCNVDFNTTPVSIHVIKLGDADGNGKITVQDAKEMTDWATDESVVINNEYSTVYDMNKDGVIDGVDFALLRNAIVGNDDYLTT